MKLRIRTTFLGILVLAAILPLCLALVVAESIGYRALRKAHGRLFETKAQSLAHSFSLAVNEQLENLDDWAVIARLAERVRANGAPGPGADAATLQARIAELEARWRDLPADDPVLRGILENEIARELRTMQKVEPLFAEILVTDAQGQLIAATGKTTDFWQADERWWQRAFAMTDRHAYLEGIHYDPSAGVYSLDAAMPLYASTSVPGPPVGIIKGVINASPLLAIAASKFADDKTIQQLVLNDGRILARLSGPAVQPLAESISADALAHIRKERSGAKLLPLDGSAQQLVGFAPIRLRERLPKSLEVTGLSPMFVVVSEDARAALAPIRKQVLIIGGAGTLFILACALGSYFIAGRKILAPIEALRTAVQAIGRSAKLEDATAPLPAALPALEPLRRIRTGDELEELSREFEYMAGRVLTYHDRLEREIALKTAEIDRDLELAREFQEALMPRGYPRVPAVESGGEISLHFQHTYKPASSVGGDFFDVIKLSDQRAGIFIADVMGHGARSALVTAILRALLQNLAPGHEEPAQFLSALNHHFHEIVRGSTETIFVSAFYLVIDTQSATATYACAGHPSPFFADQTTGEILPLLTGLKANPALGLFPTCQYSQWLRPVRAGDLFLLFTDGVHEAYAASGEEFGLARLRAVVAANLQGSPDQITAAVVAAIHEFIQPDAPADDICLVSVKIGSPSAPVPEEWSQVAATQM